MEYEILREIFNLCPNNQMRDVFIQEAEVADPESFVRSQLKGRCIQLTREDRSDGTLVIHAVTDGLAQRFSFTPL